MHFSYDRGTAAFLLTYSESLSLSKRAAPRLEGTAPPGIRINYFTAPATASVKLFCSMKNTMTVGSVQMVTPAMTTP